MRDANGKFSWGRTCIHYMIAGFPGPVEEPFCQDRFVRWRPLQPAGGASSGGGADIGRTGPCPG